MRLIDLMGSLFKGGDCCSDQELLFAFSPTKVRRLPGMHPHLLRHACATHMLDNGCPLGVISQIVGP